MMCSFYRLLSTAALACFFFQGEAQKPTAKPKSVAARPAISSNTTPTTGGKLPYSITLKAPQYRPGQLVYLAYFYGKNFNLEDSAFLDNNRTAVFNGKNNPAAKKEGLNKYRIPGGIYLVFLPGNSRTVDFLLDKERQVIIQVNDSNDINGKTTFTGLRENFLYLEYKQRSTDFGMRMQYAQDAYKAATTAADSARLEADYNQASKDLNAYRQSITKDHPTSMLTALLAAMKDPEFPITQPKTREDSLSNYYYYREHYWDGVTFMDERVLRTPFFLPRFERYYRETLVQHPDSIKKVIDYQLLFARNAPEIYKFMLNWLTDEYMYPKIMGLDAVFVHLFEKYHSKGLTNWLSEKQIESITRRAYFVMSNLIGEPAASLDLVDRNGKPDPLYEVRASYTLVMFWDPNCGHCKEEIPHIDSLYRNGWKEKGIQIYAVLSAEDNETIRKAWTEFIDSNHIADWHHVYLTKEMEAAEKAQGRMNFHQAYDVTQTPTLYLLDKDKRIIGKKLTWQQTNELLKEKMKTNQN